jgi:hypothetical protein
MTAISGGFRLNLNCGLTGLSGILIVCNNGRELLASQRAKVGRFKLADFFVPLTGLHCRLEIA